MLVEYTPIATAVFSAYFFIVIWNHYRKNPKPYLLWWAIGVLTFGLGTVTESINVLFGWNQVNFRLWYISGALLGGFSLAQGSVYLLMHQRFSNITATIAIIVIIIGSCCVIASPLTLPESFDGKLGGSIFTWQWVRFFSPLINVYSFIFLAGGAAYSAFKYARQKEKEKRFIGNALIAAGALLPGIGGSFTRAGYVNVLFVTEFVGLLFIYFGYSLIKNDTSISIHATQLK